MNIRITPGKLIAIATIFVIGLLSIFTIGARLVTAGVMENIQASMTNFMPVLFNRQAVEPVVTGNALIVFSSTATTDGNGGGRVGMNQICLSEDPASHFCNVSEIHTAWTDRGVVFQSPFAESWVDYTPSNNWTDGSCWGWTANDNSKSGIKINENASKTDGIVCNYVFQVSCCKTAP